MKGIIFDLEANGRLYEATKIHCIAYQEIDIDWSKLIKTSLNLMVSPTIGTLKDILSDKDIIIGHNISGYDLPLLNKLYDISIPKNIIIFDTFLGSQLVKPNAKHNHSIEDLAAELKLSIPKIHIDDWSVYTLKMGTRCVNDVKINMAILKRLMKTWIWEKPGVMKLEANAAMIHARQELHGVRFNVLEATRLLREFDEKIKILEEDITRGIPPKIKKGVTVKEPFTKSGKLKVTARVHTIISVPESPITKIMPARYVGPFSKLEFIPFNLNSSKQVTDYLLGIGWKPTHWNYVTDEFGRTVKSSPKLTEESWGSLPGKLGKKIGEFKMLSHRRRWICNQKDSRKGALSTVRKDGRVPAEAMTCATPTSRYRHTRTVCNIPRPSSPYGKEIRSLFCVPDGSLMIGCDLCGIEARMLAHYCMGYPGGKELAELILDGDFHQHNADLWGVDRNTAKSGLYALMYGCREAKLASTLGKPRKEGVRLMNNFWGSHPAIKHLIDNLERAMDSKKNIHSIDGRVLDIRRKQTVLNTLLQGSAAVVFKTWMNITNSSPSPVFFQIIAYHDELQFEVSESYVSYADKIGENICKNARMAGEFLGVNVPIKAEYKIGTNWSETH
jgi:DNA polymerase I-like protein with 3'-5' exonuclease and polymerase domains